MSRTFAIISLSLCLGVAPCGLFALPLDSVKPTVLAASDPSPVPGEVVTYTVSLSGPANSAGYLTVSSSTLSNFSSLPSQAAYNQGDTEVQFNGTIAANAIGGIQVSAGNTAGAASLISVVAMEDSSTSGPVAFRF